MHNINLEIRTFLLDTVVGLGVCVVLMTSVESLLKTEQ